MERTAMNRKEFERRAVFARVECGEMKLKEAAPLLAVSYRQAKRQYKRFRAEGPAGLVHRSVGRASNHAHARAERERVLEIIPSTTGESRIGVQGSGSVRHWFRSTCGRITGSGCRARHCGTG